MPESNEPTISAAASAVAAYILKQHIKAGGTLEIPSPTEPGDAPITGPYSVAKVNGCDRYALLSNGGRRCLVETPDETVARWLAARLTALTTIAERGVFDPETFAASVLAGASPGEALLLDHAEFSEPLDAELAARLRARQAIVAAACAGDAAGLDAAVAAFRAAGGRG
jgi:hypothetical protein